jgi:Holliday junction resolvasome RuvABC endonuclease subunit
MEGSETLLAPRDLLPTVEFPIWGIDPSSKRIAAAIILPDGTLAWDNVKLPEPPDRTTRFAEAYAIQVEFFRSIPFEPALVFIEEPFMPRDRREAPTHLLMYGVTLAALGEVLGAIPLTELTASQWKARAMGQGNGHAKKPAIMAWAQNIGYHGRMEDEADAIGVAYGGAALYQSQKQPIAA